MIPLWMLQKANGRVITDVPPHGTLFLAGLVRIFEGIPIHVTDRMRDEIIAIKRRGGRLFFLGVGGSAANASHAVNDFRKIARIESYCPTDNVAELTARTNDEGWHRSFVAWLIGSKLSKNDAVFVLSVGGGNEHTSPNIVHALAHAQQVGATILGIVGRDGGETLKRATACVLVPTVDDARITPFVESMQSVLLHLFVTDPALQV